MEGTDRSLVWLGMNQTDSEPQIDQPTNLYVSPEEEAILKTMFASYRRVTIKEELRGGFSGSRVFLVRPIQDEHSPELLSVVKVAPLGLIQEEWLAYQSYVHNKLPGVAEIAGEPTLLPEGQWGGLRYTLLGESGTFEIESLNKYAHHASIEDIRYVLEERLFKIIGPRWWQFSQAVADWPVQASYDFLLPVNLLIEPAIPPAGVSPQPLEPNALPHQPVSQGSYVRLEGFVVTEVDRQQRAVTLNVPRRLDRLLVSSYRLRVQPVENIEHCQAGAVIASLEGRVTATRHDQLLAIAQDVLGGDFDLLADTVTSPCGTTLPNPLNVLPILLDKARDVRLSCIHGDLNLENILVEPEGRNVSLIDFSTVRRDHVLHDMLRLETEITTKLLPEALAHVDRPVETIASLHRWLQGHRPIPPSVFRAGISKPADMLMITRNMAKQCLFDQGDWQEYYGGLVLYLLGALKFRNLDRVPLAPLPKQTAFWSAAAVSHLIWDLIQSDLRATRGAGTGKIRVATEVREQAGGIMRDKGVTRGEEHGPTAHLIDKMLGGYRITEQFGLGGMAIVYKAYQPSMDRHVALKVLTTHLTQNPSFVQRFQQEARIIAKLEHLHIVPVYDYGEEEGYLYLVMRFIEAGTLRDRLESGPLPLDQVRRVVMQIGSALEYAHQLGVVHRDIKPSNVLIDAQGDCYLTDFGIAKMVEGTVGMTGSGLIGTPHYMAPEQGQSLPVDRRTDVYAMGVVVYEMLTGQKPFDAETPLAVVLKHVTAPLPLLRSTRPDLPEAIEGVVLKALAKKPADRYQSIGDLVAAFDQAVRAGSLTMSAAALPYAMASGQVSPAHDEASPWSHLVELGQRQSARYLEVVQGGGKGKYIPSLYCPREAIEQEIDRFLDSDKTGMVITGEAGRGKTNLLCRLAEELPKQGHAVFLYNCGNLAQLEVDQELAQDLFLPAGSSFIQYAETTGQKALEADRYFVVLFDAVDEFRHEGASRAGDLIKSINGLIGRSSYPRIKVMLTCRAPTWRRLDIMGYTNLDWGRYYTPQGGEHTFSLAEFTVDEFHRAYPLYRGRFELKSALDSLSPTTAQRCRDPLLLRLTASAYSGSEIPFDAPSLNVFQMYYDRVERREDRRFLEQLAAEMWESKTTSLAYDYLVDHEKMGEQVVEGQDCAYERLKDLGFLVEVERDYFTSVQFTYERILEYALCRHILRTQRSIGAAYIAQLLDGAAEFSSAWGAAQFVVLVTRDTKGLLLELSDSVDYLVRQFVLETLLLEYQEQLPTVIGWLLEMVRSKSELTRRLALNVAYHIGREARSVFVEGASSHVESTREAVANYALLLWKKDPDMGLDIVQGLIEHLQIRTLLSAPYALDSIFRTSFLFHTNCWDRYLVWRIAKLEEGVYRKLGITSLHSLDSAPGKVIERAVKGVLRRIVLGIFRTVTGSTTAHVSRASFEAALQLPQEGRTRLERIIPFLDPLRKEVGEIAEDLRYLFEMQYGLAAVLSLAVLGVQLQSNFRPTSQLLLDLFGRLGEAGRFALFVPFINLTFPTTPDYYELAWRLTRRLLQENPDSLFFGDPWGTGNYLDATIATGIACCLHTGKLDIHFWLIEQAIETGDHRLLKKCVSNMAVLGFFFPQQALEVLFESGIDPTSSLIKEELIQSLAAIRTLHAEEVDLALLRSRMPADFLRKVWATSEPELIRVCVDAISLLTWVIYYSTNSTRAREFITFFALQIAKAHSPEDVADPVTEYWWKRILEGNFGILKSIVDKDYFAEYEGTGEINRVAPDNMHGGTTTT